MNIEYQKKLITLLTIFLLCISFSIIPVDGKTGQQKYIYQLSSTTDGYIDITVEEVWEMCISSSNGITLPIDVRSGVEWLDSRIDTPYPEYSRHYPISSLQTESGLQNFLEEYNGKDVIMYCKSGGRSSSAAQILVDHNFNGTIYNMLGGITAWKNAGLPIKEGNTLPNQPSIPAGPTICSIGRACTFETSASDPDNDVVRYGWDMNSDKNVDVWTEYAISGEIIQISYIWNEPGIYNISVLSEDIVGSQSTFSEVRTITASSPPSDPSIDGPAQIKNGVEQTYSFSSIDLDEDELFYLIEWGDGGSTDWLGPQEQGIPFEVSHTWEEQQTYQIKAKAKDINDLESDWSILEISVPKQYENQKQYLEALFHHFKWIISVLF
jgi:rhodanese-related sulfurtransferase